MLDDLEMNGAAADPLRQDRREFTVTPGQTIAEVVSSAPTGAGDLDVFLKVNGRYEHVAPKDWWTTRVGAADGVWIQPKYRGSVVASVLASAGVFAAGSAAAAWVAFGVNVLAAIALNSFITPPNQSGSRRVDPDNPTLTGLQNRVPGEGEAIPMVVGRYKFAPDKSALGYTMRAGTTDWRHERFCLGATAEEGGLLVLESLKSGNTDITSFDNYQIQFRNVDRDATLAHMPALGGSNVQWLYGTQTMGLYNADVVPDPDNARLLQNTSVVRSSPINTRTVYVNVAFPEGLFRQRESSGNPDWREVSVQFRYRRASGGDWVTAAIQTYRARHAARLQKGFRLDFPDADTWEVEITRLTEDFDVTKADRPGGSRLFLEEFNWIQEGTLPSPANIAEMTLVLKATDQLNGQLDPINVIARQKTPVYRSGAWQPAEETRHPADSMLALLRGAHLRKQPVTDAEIDLDALAAWRDQEPDWTFDALLNGDDALGTVLDEMTAVARANGGFTNGRHSVVRDDPNAPFTQLLTNRNTWDFRGEVFLNRELDALDVLFRSEANDWAMDSVRVYAAGKNAGNVDPAKVETMEVPGLTVGLADDLTNVENLAWYHLGQAALRRDAFYVKCNLDQLPAVRGSRVLLVHDVPLLGYGGARVASNNDGAQTIELDDSLGMPNGVTIQATLRTRDSNLLQFRAVHNQGILTVQPGTESSQNGPYSFAQIRNDDLIALENIQVQMQCIVVEVNEEADLTAELKLVPAAPSLFDDLNRPHNPYVQPLNIVAAAANVVVNAQIDPDYNELNVAMTWGITAGRVPWDWRIDLEDEDGDPIATKVVTDRSVNFRVANEHRGTLTAVIVGRLEDRRSVRVRVSIDVDVLIADIENPITLPFFNATAVTIQTPATPPEIPREQPAIFMEWTLPPFDVRSIEFEARIGLNTVIQTTTGAPETGQSHLNGVILGDTTYQVRARPRIRNRVTDWTSWKSVTTDDTRISFADLGDEVFQQITDSVDAAFDERVLAEAAARASGDARDRVEEIAASLLPPNLVDNDTFETDNRGDFASPGDWRFAAGEGRDGSNAMVMDSATGGSLPITLDIAVTEGEKVTLGIWYRSTAATVPVQNQMGLDGFGTQGRVSIDDNSGEWVFAQVQATVPTGVTTTRIRAFSWNGDFEDVLWIDRLQLVRGWIDLDAQAVIENLNDSAASAALSAAEAEAARGQAVTAQTNAEGAATSAFNFSQTSAKLLLAQGRVGVDGLNASFESGDVGDTGVPPGWEGAAHDVGAFDNLQLDADVPTASPTGSARSFGTKFLNGGRWWRLSKYFSVEPGSTLRAGLQVWLSEPQDLTTGDGTQDPQFIDEDDVLLLITWYDSSGAELFTNSTRGASSQYWTANGVRPPVKGWFGYQTELEIAPNDAAYMRVDIVAVDGNATIVNDRKDYQTYASGNATLLVDDFTVNVVSGAVVEVGPNGLNTARIGEAATVSEQAASGFADQAGEAAVFARTRTETLARFLGQGMSPNPIFEEWPDTAQQPPGWDILTNEGSWSNVDQAGGAKYTNAVVLATATALEGGPSDARPRMRLVTGADGNPSVNPDLVERVLVTGEFTLLAGDWESALVEVRWVGANERTARIRLWDRFLDAFNVTQKLEIYVERPDTYQVGAGDRIELRVFATSDFDDGIEYSVAEFRIDSLQMQDVTSSAVASQTSQAFALTDQLASASYTFRVGAGGAAAGLELVAVDDLKNGPQSALRANADWIILDGTVLGKHFISDIIEARHIGAQVVNATHVQTKTLGAEHTRTGGLTADVMRAGLVTVTTQLLAPNVISSTNQSNPISARPLTIPQNSFTSTITTGSFGVRVGSGTHVIKVTHMLEMQGLPIGAFNSLVRYNGVVIFDFFWRRRGSGGNWGQGGITGGAMKMPVLSGGLFTNSHENLVYPGGANATYDFYGRVQFVGSPGSRCNIFNAWLKAEAIRQ